MPLMTVTGVQLYERRFRGSPLWGTMGPTAVVRAGNGAAFDGTRWFFWGGGGRLYGGNEWYSFDFRTLTWTRLGMPSPLVGEDRGSTRDRPCPAPATGMAAARTGDGVVWHPVTRSIWVIAVEDFCMDGVFRPRPLVWEFVPDAGQWRSHSLPGPLPADAKSAWNPVTNSIVALGDAGRATVALEIDVNGAVNRRTGGSVSGPGSMVFDSDRRRLYLIGRGGDDAAIFSVEGGGTQVRLLTPLPDGLATAGGAVAGVAYHPPSRRLFLWPGGRDVWTWDPDSGQFERHSGIGPEAPNSSRSEGVFSKWVYLAKADVFAGFDDDREGIWLYRPAIDPGEPADPRAVAACVANGAQSTCFRRLATAVAAARDGAVVTVRPGRWGGGAVVAADRVTIRGEPGAIVHTRAAEGRAALLVRGDDTVIENLGCTDIVGDTGASACVELASGRNITLRNVEFRDSGRGFLGGGGTVTIEDGTFERLGSADGGAIDVTGGEALVLRRSRVLAGRDGSISVASRAARTQIDTSVIASLDGRDGTLIDVASGGEISIRTSVIEKGPFSVNTRVIAIGAAPALTAEGEGQQSSLVLSGNTFIIDRLGVSRILDIEDAATSVIQDNDVVGGVALPLAGNRWYVDRQAAGLPPYPAIWNVVFPQSRAGTK